MEPLVTTDWLAEELGKPDLVVFDATKYLPNEPKDGHAEFLAAHIPGARYFDIDAIADPDTDLPHMVPTPGRFAKLMAQLGVGNALARGVLRPEGAGLGGARLVADGIVRPRQRRGAGRRIAEMAEGRPRHAIRRAAGAARPRRFRPDFRAARLRGVGDVLRNTETRAELVLDARAAGRFTGAMPEPRAGMRSGHIPGSANIPYTDLLHADGTFRPVAELSRAVRPGRRRWHTRPPVTSCGSGVTACILTLGLRLAGLPEGAVYDGSWTEWGGRADTPVETG